jgi:prepilin signal peptidase PulO-like enzyme (type II secretory pathway)
VAALRVSAGAAPDHTRESLTVVPVPVSDVVAILRRPPALATTVLLAAGLTGLALARSGPSAGTLRMIPILAALAAIIVLDLWSHTIPDVVSLPGLGYALVMAAVFRQPPLLVAVQGVLVCGGLVWAMAIASRGSVGGGDIKLMAMLGATLGWKLGLVAWALSQVAGFVVGMALITRGLRQWQDPLPAGALMAAFGALLIATSP